MSFTPRYPDLVAMLQQSRAKHAHRPLFGTKRNGVWGWMTYAEFARDVDAARAGLAGLGVGPGDRVAVISNNRVEWAIGAYATFGRGAAYVPMYEAQRPEEQRFIINDSRAKVALVATPAIADMLLTAKAELPHLQHVICFEGDFAKLLQTPPDAPVGLEPKTVACAIYTSGTTGVPKGVLLTHANLASNISAALSLFPLLPEDRSLSFLPWAHVFGQTCELHTLLSGGASMALCEGIPKLMDNLAEVRPTVLMAVPNIFNRIYDGVRKKMAEGPAPVKTLFEKGLEVAKRKNRGERLRKRERLLLLAAQRVVFQTIVGRLGGQLKYALSGGAALSREVAEFIDALGILVFEGYGLTETSPIATVNSPLARRIGSVGKPLPGVSVKLDHQASGDPTEGEIVVYGHNVMAGYDHLPEENAKVFTPDGGFRTGDLGKFDTDGFLYITGRLKELYKLENGKYVAPVALENKLTLSPYIVQAMVYGANRPHNVALLVPNKPSLLAWAEKQGLPTGDYPALLKQEQVRALFRAELDGAAATFKGFESIRGFELVADEFTVDNDLLTPKLSMKRRNIVQRYQAALDALYVARQVA